MLTDLKKILLEIKDNLNQLSLNQKEWFNVNELSVYLSISPVTVYKYVHEKTIPFYKIPESSKLIFNKHEIDQWILNSNENKKKLTQNEIVEIANSILER